MKIIIRLIVSLLFMQMMSLPVIANTDPSMSEAKSVYLHTKHNTVKQVKLNKITLSPENQSLLLKRIEHLHDKQSPQMFMSLMEENNFPSSVSLGMNGVPVLDQGLTPLCSTYAVFAAIDAIYGGEYFSTDCFLAMMKTENIYSSHSIAFIMYSINDYGLILKKDDAFYNCNLNISTEDYVLNNSYMPAQQYKQLSQKPNFTFKNVLHFTYNWKIDLIPIKQALLNNHRVVIGVLVDASGSSAGAYGLYEQAQGGIMHWLESWLEGDSWIITPEIEEDAKNGKINDGHALVITGYDDNGIIDGPDGSKHKGVLILRNSWGSTVGDNGNFYMSYDYFKTFAHAAIEIIPNMENK